MSTPNTRKVPPNWRHPIDPDTGEFIGLFDHADYAEHIREWEVDGAIPDEKPALAEYMPQWPPEVATHFMLYETVTEGTPVSPTFATSEDLTAWVGGRRLSEVTAVFYAPRCVYCDVQIPHPVEFGIHRDAGCDGPEMRLCDRCGSHPDTPSCDEIWTRIKERLAAGELFMAHYQLS